VAAYLEPSGCGTLLKLWIQPGASRTKVVGPHGEPPRLKIQVAAPPVEGAANEELLRFLKKALGVPRSSLELVRGTGSRRKDVLCKGLSPDETEARLAPA
jgi:uncharacterized protein